MGIPHLINNLRPFAQHDALSGKDACIDGPGLAYHIYFTCLARRASSVWNPYEAAPSYEEIGKTAVAWLDALQSGGLTIKKIYFDGYLPPPKLETRLARLRAQTKRLDDFYHKNTLAPCLFRTAKFSNTEHDLFGINPTQPALIGFPAVPFLVPAVIEALLASKYASLTVVVPGEADTFCAAYLKENGGIVITGDSDLLVHDLGLQGCVGFFKDIQRVSDILSALIFHTSFIAERLGLPKSSGIRGLAFEMVMDPHGAFRKLLAQTTSISGSAAASYEVEYKVFCKEYASPRSVDHQKVDDDAQTDLRILKTLQGLDPRISEYVLQFPSISKLAGHELTCWETPHIFLPFLLGCPVRTHAWEISTTVRQLAYGLLNLIVPKAERRVSIIEHRKQQNNAGGREWQIPSVSEIPEACKSLLQLFEQLLERIPRSSHPELFTALAIYQEIEWSSSVKKSSLCKPALRFFMEERHNALSQTSCTWEAIQFMAHLQASYYSFRWLRQIVDVLFSHNGNLPEEISLLRHYLDQLPTLTKSPDLRRMSSVAQKVKAMGIVRVSYDILGLAYHEELSTQPGRKNKKNSKKKQKKNGSITAEPKRPSNIFAVLGAP